MMRKYAPVTALLSLLAPALTGCWTAPVANVQPKGEARLIQAAIAVRSVKGPALVQSVDAGKRSIVVLYPSASATATYRVGPGVSNLDAIRAGDKVRVTLVEELTVYVLKKGQLPGARGAPETIKTDAKVLMVDPSYRLLTLQYGNGDAETFKVGLYVKLMEMEAGDDVVIRPIEAVALKPEKS